MKKKIFKIFEFLKNILFPPKCVFCERILEPNQSIRVCGDCSKEIEFCSDAVCCEKCGKPILGFGEKRICYFCLNHSPKYFDRIVSAFVYDGIVQKAVIRYKDKGLSGHCEVFSSCVAARIFEEYPNIKFDFLCGVLPHNKRVDFDQVQLLCRNLSKKLNLPYKKALFVKTRKTAKQSGLNFKERLENLKESLDIADKSMVEGKTILLIDDVCTTRATIIEYSRALKKAGAKRVYAATVATVKNNEK